MKVKVGLWYDSMMNVMEVEVFDNDLTSEDILLSIIHGRENNGFDVVTIKDNYVAFNDGVRMMLSNHHVTHTLEFNDIFTEARQTLKEFTSGEESQ